MKAMLEPLVAIYERRYRKSIRRPVCHSMLKFLRVTLLGNLVHSAPPVASLTSYCWYPKSAPNLTSFFQ
jgi:hypothetical protein